MVRILSITALALAAISAVSGLTIPRLNTHAIRNSHHEVRLPFGSYELFPKRLSQIYPKYHRRGSKTGCKARPPGYVSGGNNTSSSTSWTPTPTSTPAYVASTPVESPQPDQPSESPSPTSSTPSPSPTPSPASDASDSSSSNNNSGNDNSGNTNSGVNTGGVYVLIIFQIFSS